jgi:hypothetical protein
MRDAVARFRLRPASTAPAALPPLDSLPQDLRARILALLAPTQGAAAHASHRSPDRDERGFAGF